MFDHVADALKEPALIRLEDNIFVARFEAVKIYSALAAVERLLETGVVKKGDTLVDSSSGIYAYALALACHRHGMDCHIVGSKAIDRTLRLQLEILGATVEQVEASGSLKFDQGARVRRVEEIIRQNPGCHWMRQYHDPIHYLGYEAFADLVTREIGTDGLTVAGGVGTGAATGGLVTYLRKSDPTVRLCGIQPFGSITFGGGAVEDAAAVMAGIGASLPFDNVHHDLYDTVHWVSFDFGLSGCVALLRRHAVFAGLSSGASYLATLWEAGVRPNRRYLWIAADTGHRYADSVFAQHPRALRLEQLVPIRIDRTDDLALPWSVMDWGRRGDPTKGGRALDDDRRA
ncbi:MAG TPA: pyridoxal-phosphate dependent enzyme [Actinomycetes bacterium]|nr:pyridoxal-phosphate dependent enzyme [Actinomycetes bacterium]